MIALVIPAYNEALRLPSLLDALAASPGRQAVPACQFVVVDDGSTAENVSAERAAVERAAHRFAAEGTPHRVRFVQAERNRGKGAAIRLGWNSVVGAPAWLGFVDADGAIAASEIWRVLGLLGGDMPVDVLAGSRILMAGRQVERRLVRHLQGRVFATLAERLFKLGFYDTQCGFKLFRRELLWPCLPALREERWLLDLEVLTLLRGAGARMREEPIDWAEPGGSKVVPGLDALRMAAGMVLLERRLARGRRGR